MYLPVGAGPVDANFVEAGLVDANFCRSLKLYHDGRVDTAQNIFVLFLGGHGLVLMSNPNTIAELTMMVVFKDRCGLLCSQLLSGYLRRGKMKCRVLQPTNYPHSGIRVGLCVQYPCPERG